MVTRRLRLSPLTLILALGSGLATAGCGGDGDDCPACGAADGAGCEGTPDAALDLAPDAASPGDGARGCGLLVNGNAEAGSLAGWTSDVGAFAAVQWEADRLPPPAEGGWLFFAGSTAEARMHQDVDVAARAVDIDAGRVSAHLEAQVRDWENDDLAYLEIEALDASGGSLAARASGAFGGGVWTAGSLGLTLPVGTRAVRVALRGERLAGSDNDAYFDAVELCLDGTEPVAEETMDVAPYLTWVTEDAVTVAWETQAAGLGRVAFGTTPQLGAAVTETEASTHHRVHLTGLPGDTTIYYRVEPATDGAAGEYPGALHSFRTAPPPEGASFRFVAWGDSQHGTAVFTPLVARMAAVAPAFLVASGDVVQEATEANFHHQFLRPLAPVASAAPLLVAPGNHDSTDGLALFDQHLDQPGHCFGWRYGAVAFLILDSEVALPAVETADCLTAVFASDEWQSAGRRIAVFHRPPRVDYWEGGFYTGEDWVRDLLEPQLQSAGVDLCITGHSHVYTYGPPSGTGGVTWVTIGGGGGSLEPDSSQVADWEEISVVIARHHFLLLSVDGDTLEARVIADTGETLHGFAIP